MDEGAGDSTQDWLLPEHSRPPTVAELQRGIDEALATARASEEAVMTVGAAALDAAEQARRAAELAERASATAAEAHERVLAVAAAPPQAERPAEPEDSLGDFSERADRLVARLRRLQRVPLAAPASSGVADRSRSGR